MNVTIKQLLVGVLIGSSAIGLMIHRLSKKAAAADVKPTVLQNAPHHKLASAKKVSQAKHHKHSESQLSSGKLYG